MNEACDVIAEMIRVLESIQSSVPSTESDLQSVPMITRDGFLKIGVMLSVSAGVTEETLISFIKDYYRQQTVIQH